MSAPLDLEAIETDLRAARAFGPASPVARLVVETHAPAVIAEVRRLQAVHAEALRVWDTAAYVTDGGAGTPGYVVPVDAMSALDDALAAHLDAALTVRPA